MRILRLRVGGLALITAVGLSFSSAAGAVMADEPKLPEPTGSYPVGTVTLHFVDQGRADEAFPSHERELMVQLWYPAAEQGGQKAAYMPGKAAEAMGFGDADPLPQTHASEGAPVSPDKATYPVVVYSAGFTSSRSFGTALLEEMASRGYIAVAVDHPHDAAVVEYPSGQLVGPNMDGLPDPSRTDVESWDQGNKILLPPRVADMTFVLDQLALLNGGENPDADGKAVPDGLGKALDLANIGVVGHSLGGTTAAQTLVTDNRVKAGLMLDSPVPQEVREKGVDRPIMLMKSEQPDPNDTVAITWDQTGKRGWNKAVVLKGSGHNTYTDLAALCHQSSTPSCQQMQPGLGTIAGIRAVQLQRDYVIAFLDQHLRGQMQAALEGPSDKNPEITFLP